MSERVLAERLGKLSLEGKVRLLTGARWRLGVADLAALWARARELAPGPPARPDASTPA